MKILFLTQIIPFPPDAGPKVKTWHVLRHLADRGYDITLVSFVREEEEKFVENMRAVCSDLYTVPIQRSRLADIFYWLRSLISQRPFLIERDDISAMRSLVQKLLENESFDVIHADQLTMAQFVTTENSTSDNTAYIETIDGSMEWKKLGDLNVQTATPKRIFDAHNATWTVMRRMKEMAHFFLNPFLTRETKLLKLYEGMIVHTFDHTLAVSNVDYAALEEAEANYRRIIGSDDHYPTRIHIIPIAVDASGYQRATPYTSCTNILAIGSLHYPPNADGIIWFVREVFPQIRKQIPAAKLIVIGKSPPSKLVSLADSMSEAISVAGYVPDLQPYLDSSQVMVVPVRAGGGMRVRILEGLAWGIPMVTTSIGLEGIDAVPGQDILVANDKYGFAEAVSSLLKSESLRNQISENGLKVVHERYDWQIVMRELDNVYA
jgi:glycosyltransferase involved in cell wall biosynthesis